MMPKFLKCKQNITDFFFLGNTKYLWVNGQYDTFSYIFKNTTSWSFTPHTHNFFHNILLVFEDFTPGVSQESPLTIPGQ